MNSIMQNCSLKRKNKQYCKVAYEQQLIYRFTKIVISVDNLICCSFSLNYSGRFGTKKCHAWI